MTAATASCDGQVHAQVVHHIPGRTRVRLPGRFHEPRQLEQLREKVAAGKGVTGVRTNAETGSLLVLHQPDVDLGDLAHLLGESAHLVLDYLPSSERKDIEHEASDLAQRVKTYFQGLDRRVEAATDGWIDLKMLMPIGLAAGALVQVLRNGIGLKDISPYVLAYYAVDSFIKLHPPAFAQPDSNPLPEP